MKNIVFFLLISISNITFAQTWYSEKYFSNDLNDVVFVDSLNGYAVGNSGRFLKTTNGGATWTGSQIANGETLFSLFFANENIGYIGGYGSVYKTINKGITWQKILNNTLYGALVDVYCTDINTCYFATESFNSELVYTNDGGASWNTKVIDNDNFDLLRSVFFTNQSTGYIATSYDLFKTTNSGVNWNKLSGYSTLGANSGLRDIYFPSNLVGYVVARNGFILKTTDGGSSWIGLNSGTTEDLLSVYFLSEDKGFICGNNGTILKTENGGTTWVHQQSETTNHLKAIYFANEMTGASVGSAGRVVTTKTTTTSIDNKYDDLSSNLKCFPNPVSSQLSISIDNSNNEPIYTYIYNSQGKEIYRDVDEIDDSKTIDTSDFESGFYILKVKKGEKDYLRKVVVTK